MHGNAFIQWPGFRGISPPFPAAVNLNVAATGIFLPPIFPVSFSASSWRLDIVIKQTIDLVTGSAKEERDHVEQPITSVIILLPFTDCEIPPKFNSMHKPNPTAAGVRARLEPS